jgi:Fe(II)/alpha-ketoglutarate-dependent arginine beta-hydroxylase
MWKIELSDTEIVETQKLLKYVAAKIETVESEAFLKDAVLYAHEIPIRVRSFLNDFRLQEPPSGICLVSGYPVDGERIGRTPAHWKYKAKDSQPLEEQILLVLLGSLLGDLLGWATQQDGYVVHDVLPIKEHENEQLGTGSEQTLWWHTEDAFHPYRADYIGFLCLRNLDSVATTIGTLDISKLEPKYVRALFEPRYTIRPDESHKEKNESDLRKTSRVNSDDDLVSISYEKIKQMDTNPEKIAVLFGSPQSPYLRLDPYFMNPPEGDQEACVALNALTELIEANLSELVLQPGDYCFIDNFRVVHGRKPFKARYDGSDRWIKRISMTRDLRKSRDSRTRFDSRVIF